jgi:OOP family OmpA-OmpF porin
VVPGSATPAGTSETEAGEGEAGETDAGAAAAPEAPAPAAPDFSGDTSPSVAPTDKTIRPLPRPEDLEAEGTP